MSLRAVRRISVLAVAVACTLSLATPVQADNWGGWKSGPVATVPDGCVGTGTALYSSDTPYKRNVAAINGCAVGYNMEVWLQHSAADGSIIHYCNHTGGNRAQCQLQRATSSGEFWRWQSQADNSIIWICVGQSGVTQSCFGSQD